jgi:hypothetical protein
MTRNLTVILLIPAVKNMYTNLFKTQMATAFLQKNQKKLLKQQMLHFYL